LATSILNGRIKKHIDGASIHHTSSLERRECISDYRCTSAACMQADGSNDNRWSWSCDREALSQ